MFNDGIDEEEDFLALVESPKNADTVAPVANPAPTKLAEHCLSSGNASDTEAPPAPTNMPSFEEFKETLTEFYAKYNFGNLDKVPYITEKFFFRRWDLWKQLSIKYRLSPRQSSDLWIRFNIKFDGVSECARRLFDSDETVQVASDSLENRRNIWSTLLGPVLEDNREQYSKHLSEIQTKLASKSDSQDSSQIIHLDVVRTHQELGFFQEVCI